MYKVVIDIYGADGGIAPILSGAAQALSEDPELFITFAGDEETVTAEMERLGMDRSRYFVINTDDSISATASPTEILPGREKKKSSMALALDCLKREDDCLGMLSAGNTGALFVGSIFRLGLRDGLRAPALSTSLPISDGKSFVCLCDCGANVDCKARDLEGFALLGNEFAKNVYGLPSPRIGLLSVGSEEGKGNALTKEAYPLLKALPINFIGNVEGSDLFSGKADVIVCDGFSGNILLKNAEAVGKYAMALSRSALEEGGADGSAIAEAQELFSSRFDFNSRGGATFLGTKKPLIKMHGSANPLTVVSCIRQLKLLCNKHFDGQAH